MNFSIKMTIPEARKIFEYNEPDILEYGNVSVQETIIDWFSENVKGEWNHSWIPPRPKESDIITFVFSNEEDAIAFKLRWL